MKIKPMGEMYEFLLKQKNGLTGHIEKAGYPFDMIEWGQQDIIVTKLGPAWWVYEQTAYWVDGFVRCAVLLEDTEMLQRAKEIIYNVLNAADEDGYLGPKFLKNPEELARERWPHVVFFRGCMALYEYTGDEKLLQAMEKHYLGGNFDYSAVPQSELSNRNIQNVEIMLWLYEKTGNKALLNMAVKFYDAYNVTATDDCCDRAALNDKKPYSHGVSYNEYFKLGAILYLYTGKEEYLQVSVSAYQKVDKYFMLIDGLHASDEFMWGNGLMESHETCNISDFTWSMYYLYRATGNTDYLEKIEKCIFNAGLGSIDKEFKALQYLSSVNQVILTENSESSPRNYRGSNAGRYAPNPSTACCPGNVNRFMPNYILNMWQQQNNEIYLTLYGASAVTFEEGTIEEKTNFPYDNSVHLNVECKIPFMLNIRVPKWADSMLVNGQIVSTKNGGFYKVLINCSQEIEILFETEAKIQTKKNYAYVTKGPLLYALPVPAKITKSEDEEFPTYAIVPNGTWNYGIKKASNVQVSGMDIVVDGFIVENWKLKRCKSFTQPGAMNEPSRKLKGDFVFTPPIPSKIVTDNIPYKLHLVPYGQTMARIAAFPLIRNRK